MKGMHRNLFFLVTGFLCALVTACCSTEVAAGPKERTFPDYLSGDEAQSARVYRKVLPSVVTILTYQKVFQEGRGEVLQKAVGSGVLISPQCHVLTAAHVVSGAEEIMVKTQDETLHPDEFLFRGGGIARSQGTGSEARTRQADDPDPSPLRSSPMGQGQEDTRRQGQGEVGGCHRRSVR